MCRALGDELGGQLEAVTVPSRRSRYSRSALITSGLQWAGGSVPLRRPKLTSSWSFNSFDFSNSLRLIFLRYKLLFFPFSFVFIEISSFVELAGHVSGLPVGFNLL